MRSLFFSVILIAFLLSSAKAQPRIVKFSALDSLLSHSGDSTIVINFWASWCKPCIQELPYFEELNQNFASGKFKLVLVSLDFKREFETRMKPYVEKNKIKSEVLLLDEPDYNSWIDKVHATWSGAIPATLIVSKGKKIFYEKEFHSYAELENAVKPLIQK